jgi:peptide/nickel transport system ATP-binding protein/oligopeptide transport system ATP-binding protein
VTAELIRVDGLTREFRVGGGNVVHAVNGVDLAVDRGEILAIVGESGSGKSTLGRCLLGLLPPTSGRVVFDGADLSALGRRELRAFRRRAQPVYQDPYSSLDPRWTIGRTIREALDAFEIGTKQERRERVRELVEAVGLAERHEQSRPHELSGGQRQRAAIAAALAAGPDLVVADEPVSALDVLVQAQMLNLLADLQHRLGLTLVVITHDLAVVEHLADRIAVMYLGRIVEVGRTATVLADPQHPYTRALIDSIPHPDPVRALEIPALRGEIPSPLDPPAGCHFHTRCPLAIDVCRTVVPPLAPDAAGGLAACHLAPPAATAA